MNFLIGCRFGVIQLAAGSDFAIVPAKNRAGCRGGAQYPGPVVRSGLLARWAAELIDAGDEGAQLDLEFGDVLVGDADMLLDGGHEAGEIGANGIPAGDEAVGSKDAAIIGEEARRLSVENAFGGNVNGGSHLRSALGIHDKARNSPGPRCSGRGQSKEREQDREAWGSSRRHHGVAAFTVKS